jgi:hypothetical protein
MEATAQHTQDRALEVAAQVARMVMVQMALLLWHIPVQRKEHWAELLLS